MLLRVDQHDPVLVEESLVALHHDRKVGAVPERQPRAAIGEDVGVHARSGVEGWPHTLAGIAIPGALIFSDIDARSLPDFELGEVSAALVAARNEGCLRRADLAERLEHVLSALHPGGCGLRSNEREVVVHDVVTIDAESL